MDRSRLLTAGERGLCMCRKVKTFLTSKYIFLKKNSSIIYILYEYEMMKNNIIYGSTLWNRAMDSIV